jgi:hypothetical protein
VVKAADVDGRLHQFTVIKATYLHPYQMHDDGAACAVADVQGAKATFWSPTQSAYPTRNGVATLLGIPAENVRVIFARGSGCYGINAADTVSYDAALLSQAVGKPVRVQLSRKDEMLSENYGFAYVIEQRAGLDASGTIVADQESWNASKGGRPGYDRPGNVITGMLAGYEPQPFTPRARRTGRRIERQQRRSVGVTGRVGAGWRRRNDRQRTGADAHYRLAVLHRPAAFASAPAEHLRTRELHRRDRRAAESRSGRLPAAPPRRSAIEGGCRCRREGCQLGCSTVAGFRLVERRLARRSLGEGGPRLFLRSLRRR